jgi:hypothetical protein
MIAMASTNQTEPWCSGLRFSTISRKASRSKTSFSDALTRLLGNLSLTAATHAGNDLLGKYS